MMKLITTLATICLVTQSSYADVNDVMGTPTTDEPILLAQNSSSKKKKVTTTKTTTTRRRSQPSTATKTTTTRTNRSQRGSSDSGAASGESSGGGGNVISKIKSLASSNQYEEASKLLFTVSRSSKYAGEAAQIKYMLGLMLMELKLYQTSSFVFYDVIDEELRRSGDHKYLRQSLGKLSFLSNMLDSDVLLKYAVSRIQIKDFPADSKDLFFFRYGELKLKEGQFDEAAKAFAKVDPESTVYPQALFKQGLAYAEQNKLGNAAAAYEELLNIYNNRPVTDPNRVNATMALARIYYQGKKWDRSISYYRAVPRDTIQWHDAMFEMSWAMLRSGQFFRSALSNFHTLHSPYYEEIYSPESLLLRAIVYLYICRYDEMEKTLELFDRIYRPVASNIDKMLSRSDNSKLYWDEVKRGYENAKNEKENKNRMRLNDMVTTALLRHNQIRANLNYYNMLEEEDRKINALARDWQGSAMGKFGRRIIERRKTSTEDLIGKLARNHLLKMKSELRDFFEQSDFLKFEMVSGKKEVVGKELVGKKIPRKQIVDDSSRNFFISNGYEYWPFQGEYWLDELGNYHYVGVQACQ